MHLNARCSNKPVQGVSVTLGFTTGLADDGGDVSLSATSGVARCTPSPFFATRAERVGGISLMPSITLLVIGEHEQQFLGEETFFSPTFVMPALTPRRLQENSKSNYM
jgi:hypothetical protein